ncbi:MAG: SagB family peptide dehydrogenase, partial [Leptolyngbyaceae cyanobacterium]
MADQRPSVAHHYHQRTKYHPDTLAQTAKPLDWDSQPPVFKEYKVGATYSLKEFMTGPFSSSSGQPNSTDIGPDSQQAQYWKRLSRLLLFSYGLTAKLLTTARTPVYFRSVPSAGGLYPAEIYLISRGTSHLAPGLYHYQVDTHSLIHFWDSPVWSELKRACFWHPALENTHLAVVTTAIFFRSAWRYQARGYRRICLDTGHLLGNVELACAVNDYRPHLISGFCDQALNELLYLDPTQEGVMTLLPLADLLEVQQNLPLYPTAAASGQDTDYGAIADDELLAYLHQASQITQSQDLNWRTTPRYDRATENPTSPPADESVTAEPTPQSESQDDRAIASSVSHDHDGNNSGHHNGDHEATEDPKDPTDSTPSGPSDFLPEITSGDKYNFSFCYKVCVASDPIDWSQDLQELEQTILKRRSTREYTGESITLNQLKAVLDFTYHSQHYGNQGIDPSPDYCDLSLLETFIAVSGVTGLDE